jgi:hypothetical protein
MSDAATALLVLFLVSTSTAVDASPDPPPPSEISDAGVKAWLNTYIRAEGWTVIAADNVAVTLGGPDGVEVLDGGYLRATIRHEYYRPTEFGDFHSRSNRQTWVIDCPNHRHKVTEMEIYAASNLAGDHRVMGPRPLAEAPWIASDPDSLSRRVETRICEAPTVGKRTSP